MKIFWVKCLPQNYMSTFNVYILTTYTSSNKCFCCCSLCPSILCLQCVHAAQEVTISDALPPPCGKKWCSNDDVKKSKTKQKNAIQLIRLQCVVFLRSDQLHSESSIHLRNSLNTKCLFGLSSSYWLTERYEWYITPDGWQWPERSPPLSFPARWPRRAALIKCSVPRLSGLCVWPEVSFHLS